MFLLSVTVVKMNTFPAHGWPEELQQFRCMDIHGDKHTRDKPQSDKKPLCSQHNVKPHSMQVNKGIYHRHLYLNRRQICKDSLKFHLTEK